MVGVFVAFIRVVYGRTIYMSLPKRFQTISTTIGQLGKWQLRSFEFQILARD